MPPVIVAVLPITFYIVALERVRVETISGARMRADPWRSPTFQRWTLGCELGNPTLAYSVILIVL